MSIVLQIPDVVDIVQSPDNLAELVGLNMSVS
jgi:hypothetical protein